MTINVDDFIDESPAVKAKSRKAVVGKVAELLERSGIDVDDIGRVHRVNVWQGMTKNSDGEAELHDMVGLQLSPAWESGPEWPVVQPAKPVVVRHKARKPRPAGGTVTLLLPDPQIGFWRLSDGTMIPMHDEKAMDVAIQLIWAIQPDKIVNLGDFLDFSEWSSKFLVVPEFVQTTQAALDRGNAFLAEQRAAAGELAEMYLLEGNHDDRLAQSITRNARAALRLRAANTPDSWPVLSLPSLLQLVPLGVNYVGAYPAGRLTIAGGHGRQTPLVALHGKRLDMVKQAKAESQSTVQGHAHHLAVHCRTYDHAELGAQEVQSWSVGCLCRVDGAVPSTGGGYDHRGPVENHESWQQMVAVVTETEEAWQLDPILIHDGLAIYGGGVFRAEG